MWHKMDWQVCKYAYTGRIQGRELTSIRDNFRVFDSMEEGVKGYLSLSSWNGTGT